MKLFSQQLYYFRQLRTSFGNTKVRIRVIELWRKFIEDLTSFAPMVKKVLKSIKGRVKVYARHKEELHREKNSSASRLGNELKIVNTLVYLLFI